MQLYRISEITEADYGCEEGPKDGPHAYLMLEPKKRVEVSEKWISENDIEEGKYICIRADGSVIRAIRVVAAVIRSGDRFFATQRGYGEFQGGWEFPGGKIEEGERPEDALVREIREELDAMIEVEELIHTVEYEYPTFFLSMDCFLCHLKEDHIVLKEHEAAKWVTADTIGLLDWLPADITLVEKVKQLL